MRKIILSLLIISAATLCLNACSSTDDENTDTPSGSIVGKWQFDKTGTISDQQEFLTDYEHECVSHKDYIELVQGGLGKEYFYDESCVLDYGEGSWSLTENSLEFTGEDGTDAYEVLTLTNSTLKLKIENLIFIFIRK